MNMDYFINELENNKNNFEIEFEDEIYLIKKNLSCQFDLLNLYITVLVRDPYAEPDEHTRISLIALYKNLISLYSTIELTSQGLYGPARIIFRNIYEYLIISKSVAIRKDNTLLDKWETGKNISLQREIFSKVITPNSLAMRQFWDLLCKLTHGTIHSMQVMLRYDGIKEDLYVNIAFMKMLLDMNYHVLNTYVANRSIQYYTKFAVDIGNEGEFKSQKQEIRKQILAMRKSLNELSKKTVLDFCKSWTFRQE